jgi:putative transposase
MPAKNIVKIYATGYYYHVYNRGVAKQEIFREKEDYFYFMSLFKRHLQTDETSIDKFGRTVKNYSEEVELIAFCLMPNHFHLMFYLKEKAGIERIMRSVMTAYTMYFNKKYKRVGPLCQGAFLASV